MRKWTVDTKPRNSPAGFGEFTAVDSASFQIPSGSICAVLGPNGAGKSTMVKMG